MKYEIPRSALPGFEGYGPASLSKMEAWLEGPQNGSATLRFSEFPPVRSSMLTGILETRHVTKAQVLDESAGATWLHR